MLLVGLWPKLPGDCPWCTVLASLHKHIYWGRDDKAHCLPHTLGSWDCQEQIEALHRGGGLSSTQGGHRRASRPRRRSRSSLRCHSGTLTWLIPHMPLRSHRRVTAPPVCHQGATAEPPCHQMPTPCPNWPQR